MKECFPTHSTMWIKCPKQPALEKNLFKKKKKSNNCINLVEKKGACHINIRWRNVFQHILQHGSYVQNNLPWKKAYFRVPPFVSWEAPFVPWEEI